MGSYKVTSHSSLPVQSHARQLNILTNQTTAVDMYSVSKSRLIADWSFENMNPDMTLNRLLLVYRQNKMIQQTSNTVVSNHFHSVKKKLFSSARSRDFDGMLGTGLPVSMYTTKTPINMCRFNVRSSTLKNLSIFCKRQISIKLFYLYQRLQCRDKYFFTIKYLFSFFICCCQHHERKTICLYIFLISDR